jgi:small subunit ribosomal protein S17e
VSLTFDRTSISKVYVETSVQEFEIERLDLGKVRTDTVKRTSRELIKRYPERFTGDFESDKQAVNDLVTTQSKRLRNRIAGYVTRLKVVEAERIAATQAAAEGSEPAPEDVEE